LVGQVWALEGHETLQVSQIKSPRFIATPGELPFQEGRPLPPSDDEDDGQVVRSAKRFAANREVFMIHIDEDCEGLDDYDDYIFDPLDEDVDIKVEDANDT
jgi:hypothetical protein